MSEKCYYVTTPIYYVNDMPHIGSAYTTIAADVLARYHRLQGRDVFFLTGTDEHGRKVERAAAERGETPLQLADRVVRRYTELLPKLEISNDDFIRTTQERHVRVVKRAFEKFRESGDLYLADYEGWYCVSDENYLAEGDLLEDKRCPTCGKPAEWVKEPTYFFRLSKYQKRLLAFYEEYPKFISPESRRNEVIARVEQGLRDVSFTRTTIHWGVAMPWDSSHKSYVWVDALLNYISAPGYSVDAERFGRIWPADVHLIGKDILWFHTVIWPAMLMSLRVEPPRRVFAHGWWTVNGQKMSKSAGNFVDPLVPIEKFGADALRYFLMREVPFGLDGDYSDAAMVHRYNSDLGNDLGNLLYRTLNMIERYRGGVVPAAHSLDEAAGELRGAAVALQNAVAAELADLQFSRALERIWDVVRGANRFVEQAKPWALAKDAASAQALDTVLYVLAETLRIVSIHLNPFMPSTAASIQQELGMGEQPVRLSQAPWGGLPAGTRIAKGQPLFPRIDV